MGKDMVRGSTVKEMEDNMDSKDREMEDGVKAVVSRSLIP